MGPAGADDDVPIAASMRRGCGYPAIGHALGAVPRHKTTGGALTKTGVMPRSHIQVMLRAQRDEALEPIKIFSGCNFIGKCLKETS